MKIKIKNRRAFINYFLNPILKIDTLCSASVKKNHISSILHTPDRSVILYVKYDGIEADEECNINLGNIDRLVKILNCIQDVDEIELEKTENSLKYSSNEIKFTYHLLHESVVAPSKIKLEKIQSIKFNTAFTLNRKEISKVIKGSAFTIDTNKLYFDIREDGVYFQLTNKAIHNVDSATFKVCDNYSGNLVNSIPIKFETFRLIASTPASELTIRINNEIGCISITADIENVKLVFIISSLEQ